MGYFYTLLLSILVISPCYAEGGYIGGGQSTNSSVSFDNQDNGFRIDWGSKASSSIDLEWSYVDFGTSSYDDPTPNYDIEAEVHEDSVIAEFIDHGFGSHSRSEGSYNGISTIRTRGLSAGLKFKLQSNDWLQLFARASFLAWQADTMDVTIYAERVAEFRNEDGKGNPIDTPVLINGHDCDGGGTDYCREPNQPGKTFYAVDFWYGYGLIAKPFHWMALRLEYSNTTLNATDFPKAKLDQFTTSMELHF